jgi:colanic acid/amylovoran biosynthesis glycosyltransferase
VHQRISDLNLGDRVHLEGRKSEAEIVQFLARSHLFVAPFVETEAGDKDGIPTALLEAMSTGLPAIATDAGSISEVIEDGSSGVLVRQRDPIGLANGIEALLVDCDRRRRLGQAGASRVRQHFEIGVCEGIFHERIRQVTSRSCLTRQS